MKKLLCLLLAMMFAFSIAAAALAADFDLSTLSEKELKQLKGQIDKELTKRAAASSLAAGDVGNYHIDILSIELIKDMMGADAILVNYIFTNNGKESASLWLDLSTKVYQDGVECSETYTLDSLSTTMKDVQAGGSLAVSHAYALNNDYDDILIEISEGFNFYGNSAPAFSVTFELP